MVGVKGEASKRLILFLSTELRRREGGSHSESFRSLNRNKKSPVERGSPFVRL